MCRGVSCLGVFDDGVGEGRRPGGQVPRISDQREHGRRLDIALDARRLGPRWWCIAALSSRDVVVFGGSVMRLVQRDVRSPPMPRDGLTETVTACVGSKRSGTVPFVNAFARRLALVSVTWPTATVSTRPTRVAEPGSSAATRSLGSGVEVEPVEQAAHRRSMSSTIARTPARSWPAGSSTGQSS